MPTNYYKITQRKQAISYMYRYCSIILVVLAQLWVSSCSHTQYALSSLITGSFGEDITPTEDTPYAYKIKGFTVHNIKSSIRDNPNLIYSLGANQTINLLGQPTIIKNTPTSEVWQFKGVCTLNIVWDKSGKIPKPDEEAFAQPSNNANSETLASDINYTLVWLQAYKGKKKVNATSCFIALVD